MAQNVANTEGRRSSASSAWWMVAVFFAAAILSYSDRLIFSLLVSPIRNDLHISDTQVSLIEGFAFALIYSFASLPLGRLADLLPRRRVIIAGVFIWSTATIVCGYASSFGQLFAARMFVGIGEAALAPAAVSMIVDSFPITRRGTAIGVLLMGMSVGGGAALSIGGEVLRSASSGLFAVLPIVGTLAPWRAALVLLGTSGSVIILLLLTIREPERRERALADNGTLSLRMGVTLFSSRAHILVPLYLALAIASAADFSLQNWAPVLLSRRFSYSPAEVGQTLGLIAIAIGVCGTTLGGWLSDQLVKLRGEYGRISVALIAIVLGLGGTCVAFASDGNQVLAFFTLWAAMSTVAGTVGITAIQELVPNEIRGVGVALISFANMIIGLGFGTTLTAVFSDYVYRDPMMIGAAITTVAFPAGIISILLYWKTLRALGIEHRQPLLDEG